MIKIRLSDKEIELLKELKGTEILAYFAVDRKHDGYIYDGNLYMQTDKSSIKINSKSTEIPWFSGNETIKSEEIFVLDCREESLPDLKEKVTVGEKIEKIEIVTDSIFIPSQKYEISLDMALIFTTESHSYTVWRGWYFDDGLSLSIDKKYDDLYPTQSVIKDWNNFGDWEVKVDRKTETI